MKKLLITAFLFLGCKTAPELPPAPLFANDTTFQVPCEEHGFHLQTILSSRLVYVYDIRGDDGQAVRIPEDTLNDFLIQLGQ